MTAMNLLPISNSKIQTWLFWLVIIGAAVALRFVNLGQLGLWGDEGYSALSAQAILEYGYPRLPAGGIYPRSLPFSYLEALSVKIFGLNEFALRFPPALMGLFVILMTYVLSNRLFGKSVATVVVILMTFSNWEIEFSRHARMYIFFQFFFLLSVYVFYRGCIEGDKRSQWFIIPIWVFTVFAHGLSITLAAILVIPLFIRNIALKKWVLFPGLVGLGVLWVGSNRFQGYLRYGSTPLNQAVVGAEKSLPVAMPPLDLLGAFVKGGGLPFFIFIGLFAVLVLSSFRQSLKDKHYRMQYLYLLLIIGASFFNQIVLTLILLVGYTFLFFENLQSWKEKPFLIACTICVSSFFFWIAAGLSEGFQFSHVLSLMLRYPDVQDRFLKYYVPGWPLEMFIAGFGMVLLWKSAILYREKEVLFALLSFIGPVLLLGFANAHDNSARYSVHLFPLLVIFEAYAIVSLSKKKIFRKKVVLIPLALFVLFFVLSDTRLSHLVNTVARDYGDTFERPIPMSRKSYTFYPDYQSTSSYIRTHLSDGDIVVSMRELIPFYYIQKMDYVWTGAEKIQFAPLLNDTHAQRISTSALLSLFSNDQPHRIWFLSDPFRIAKLEKNGEQNALSFLSYFSNCIVYRGYDEKTTVSLIPSDKACLER